MANCADFPFETASDFQLGTFPAGSLACGNTATIEAWISWMNQQFQLVVCALQEFYEIEIEIPGISASVIPSIPGYAMPGRAGYTRDRRGRDFLGFRQRSGNVWPVALGHRGKPFHLRSPTLPDIQISETPGISAPGIDPYVLILEQVNHSLLVIEEQLGEAGVTFEFEPVPITGTICLGGPDAGGADSAPLQNIATQVNEIMLDLEEAVQNSTPSDCLGPFNTLDAGDGSLNEPEWLESINGGGTRVFAATGFTLTGWSGTISIYNFKEPGGTPGTIQTKYDLAWQPLSCARAFTVSYDWSIQGGGGAGFHTLQVQLRKVSSDNTDSVQTGITHSVFSANSDSGTQIFSVAAEDYETSQTVGIWFEALSGLAGANFSVSNLTLTPS